MEYMTFSRLFGKIYATDEEAKKARDAMYRQLKSDGKSVFRSVLKGQIKPYDSFGVSNGGVCNCFNLTVVSE